MDDEVNTFGFPNRRNFSIFIRIAVSSQNPLEPEIWIVTNRDISAYGAYAFAYGDTEVKIFLSTVVYRSKYTIVMCYV